MSMKKTVSRLERLDELTGLLSSGNHHTAETLAQALSISSRTLMRDLDVLRKKGYPIETDQGRGGGIRLHRYWGVGRLHLNYREVIDLLLSMAIMEKIGSPIFLGNLKAIRNKIAVSFPQEQRTKIQDIRNRILIGGMASVCVLDNYAESEEGMLDQLYEAFFELKKIKIIYEDAEGKTTNRTIEPQYLFLNWPVWYALAWDELREDVRCFRLDRICASEIQCESFKTRKDKRFLEDIERFTSAL